MPRTSHYKINITHEVIQDPSGEAKRYPYKLCGIRWQRVYHSFITDLTKNPPSSYYLGQSVLGFSAEEVGTHSNRSGGTIGMFLSGTPVYTIMLMGRWSSDSFMRYIRKQVLSLSHGIAKKMLTYEQFFTVPDFVHTSADGDTRHRSNTNLASTTNFNGSHANMRRGLHSTFHLSH